MPDEENPYDCVEERMSPFYVLWDEFKKLIWRCVPKRIKTA